MSGVRIFSAFAAGIALSTAPLVAQPGAAGRRDDRVVFFRQQDRPQIIFQSSDDSHCHVQSQRQMQALGGVGLFRDLPVMTPRGALTGICPWPNGLYRLGDESIVYSLRGGSSNEAGAAFCRIADPTLLDRLGGVRLVRTLEPDADLLRGRRDMGICTD